MKTLPRFVPFALFALLVAAAPVRAQYGAVEGTVKGMDGKPIAGAQIVLERTDIKGRYEVKTDKKGYYFYMGLPSGPSTRYKLQLFREGQMLWEISGVSIPTGEYRRIDIDLVKERQQQATQMTEAQKQQVEEMKKEQEKAKNLEDHFGLGMGYIKEKQYAQAITEFEAAAALDPEQFAVWANLAQAYVGANRIDKAIEAYEKSVTLKPEEAGVYNNLGTLYVKKGRLEDAKQAFTKAATLDPPHAATYYFNLGATLVNLGQMKDAAEPLRKTLELEPTRAAAYYWLGVCLYAGADSKIEGGVVKTVLQPGTVEAFEKYLELEPNGQYAADARQNLQLIETQVPAIVNIRKKKK